MPIGIPEARDGIKDRFQLVGFDEEGVEVLRGPIVVFGRPLKQPFNPGDRCRAFLPIPTASELRPCVKPVVRDRHYE